MQYNDIEKYIVSRLKDFEMSIPELETGLSNRILKQLRTLQINKDGKIKRSAANLNKVIQLERVLNDSLINKNYVNSLKKFFTVTGTISDMINEYYKETFKVGTPDSLAKAVRDGSRNAIVDRMTKGLSGILANTLQPVLNDAVIAGVEYSDLAEQIRETVNSTTNKPGIVAKYATQVATDTLNGYAAQYHKVMQSGLGFQWYVYTGSLIKTSRDFCIACKEKKYIHVSEFPAVIKGDFEEFEDIGGKIYDKTGLPQGMRAGTNKDNFQLYRGGFNCGHQLRPVYEWQVPKKIREAVYKTKVYINWKKQQTGKLI